MRFSIKSPPVDGEIKSVRKFLIIPRKIDSQWVWLEFVTKEYVYSVEEYIEGFFINTIKKWKFSKYILHE